MPKQANSMSVFGPISAGFGAVLPQFAQDLHMAEVLIGYGKDPSQKAGQVQVTYENAATVSDVERVAARAGMAFDPSEDFHAQRVASDAALRAELVAEGFDAFADQSVVENQTPFQVVVFDSYQAVAL